MTIGDRVKQLRQQRGWTQVELGEKCHIHQKQISTYERGLANPSMEMLLKLAEVFDVTLDYLAYDENSEHAPSKSKIHDRELLRRFEAVDELPEPYRMFAKELLDLLLLKHQFHQLASNGPLRITELRPTG